MKNQKQTILAFLKGETLTVLSSIGKNGPESAVLAFAEKPDLGIVFGTSNTSRKYQNIKKDPQVSLVVGWSARDKVTIQYEGVAKELDAAQSEKEAAILIAKNPSAKKFHDLPDQRYFLVTPKWIRYSDFKNQEIFEFEF